MTLATINPGEVDYEDGGSGFQVWASGFRGQVSIDSYSTKQFSDSHPACHAAYNKFSHVYMCVYIYICMHVFIHMYINMCICLDTAEYTEISLQTAV